MCVDNKNEIISKSDLWFLQNNLSMTEIEKVTNFLLFKMSYENNPYEKTSIKEILDYIGINKEKEMRLNDILKQKIMEKSTYEDIICRFELSNFLKKDLVTSSALAFQFAGNKEILKKPIIGIVGSRHPTFYGREQTERFAKHFAKQGFTIVSGGAIGIDCIANAVAIENGSSCAIIGSGIKNLYPPSNMWLFQKLRNSPNGLILSEFSSSEKPQKWNFPRRNYSIAAIVDFLLVIEATVTSGSLITAHAAAEFGVDVGALPGDIDNINSEGTNLLIKNGAFCIQTPQDVTSRIKSKYVF